MLNKTEKKFTHLSKLRQEGPRVLPQFKEFIGPSTSLMKYGKSCYSSKVLFLVTPKQRRPHPLTSIPIRQRTSLQTRYICLLLNQPFSEPKFKTSQVYIFLKHPTVQQGLPWSHYIQLYHNPLIQYQRGLSNQLNTLNPTAILRFQVERDLPA